MTTGELGEIVDAELVEGRALAPVVEPPVRPRVDQHTVLRPGEAIPTTATAERGPSYTDRDLRISEETAHALEKARAKKSAPRDTAMRGFERWCGEQGRVAVPCTTATYTEYGRHLMTRRLKVSTLRNYMSLIRTSMPAGKQPDNSLFLELLRDYRQENKRASRIRRAFPITMPYLVPMMRKAEEDGRAIGRRDAALLAFGYRFLGRSIENTSLDIEDLTVEADRIHVWLVKDKSHQDEAQTLTLHDRPDLALVPRMRRWLDHLASQGITTGPVFRHLHKNGQVVTAATRAKTATVRGDYLRGHTVNERVKHWFTAAGLVTDGRPVTSHGLRAGGATDLGMADATDQEIAEAGRWSPGSPIPRTVYVRPAQNAKRDPFSRVPVHEPQER